MNHLHFINVLGGFATNQVNLTKLESFSVKNTFDQANFYLDLEGHLEQAGVKKALEELGFPYGNFRYIRSVRIFNI